jgi:lipopolysaccharide transport system ATP-binding protein
VGTGFHGELTGRENIYLNGAILGMKKWEIDKKFDEIVVFSEIEKFIDTPVKRYSSGMYVRLAFAVAAHLEPEILIVDEVLAVGDAAFRFKCMDKMQEIREKGHTILLVSHNMDAITRICEQVFLLQAGRVTQSGTPQGVIPAYLALAQNVTSEKRWDDIGKAPGNEVVRLHGVRVCAEDGATVSAVDIRLPVGIEVEYEVLQNGHVLIPNCHFYNEEGLHLFAVQDVKSEWRHKPRPPGSYLSTAWIPGNFLAEGGLTVDINISSHIPATVLHVSARKAVGFQVIESRECDSARGDYTGPFPGVVRPLVCWSTSLNKLRLPKP